MYKKHFIIILLCSLCFLPVRYCLAAAGNNDDAGKSPAKVYVPYEELKKVFEAEGQGVFLPYKDFQKLWEAAQGRPAEISQAPFDYLISTARFNGKVEEEIARIKLELTIDILSKDWVQVPLGLGTAAVSNAVLTKANKTDIAPLLRMADGQYIFTVRGAGRYVLELDFVRQLNIQPGLAVLEYGIPSAAITTLDLLIPEENLKVDVEPMLAATTSPVDVNKVGATRLQAFLGSVSNVKLSWKPKTQAAEELESVIICEQFQHIQIDEALIRNNVQLKYNIHRGGVNSFSIQMPDQFRITDVNGANISRWDVKAGESANARPLLKVELYSMAKDQYTLNIKMERFVQESRARVPLTPIVTEKVFRQSGLIGITYSSRRTVHVENTTNLARVDTGQLPGNLQSLAGVTAYRFITSDYSGTIVIETTLPRISVNQNWQLGVDSDKLQLQGRLRYKVEKNGIFELNMNLPEPWKVDTVGPDNIVDDHQLIGQGQNRQLHILLRRETIGDFELRLAAQTDRVRPDEPVDFNLPRPDPNNLQLYEGQLVLSMAEQLQAEVKQLNQIQAIPLVQVLRDQAQRPQWISAANMTPTMAFDFRAIDANSIAGGIFNISVKPTQISATVHRLVNIQQGSIDHEAIVQYTIRYAPVDTFYLKMPVQFADEGVEITGQNIKEKPRITELPKDQVVDTNSTAGEQAPAGSTEQQKWAYYKIVLQSKVNNSYQLQVQARRTFKAGEVGQATSVEVPPILAAGKLSDQNGFIAVMKADTLAFAQPVTENLTAGDASSPVDLPYAAHRRSALLAFKCTTSSYRLTLPVVVQKEAAVFTTIVSAAVIEQVLARDGMLNTHATFFLATSKGERYAVTLPENADLTAVLLNGDEAPREVGVAANEFIVRLPPSAGQVSRFMLEVSYSLRDAQKSKLTAPELSKEIPVLQTLWRLWIPEGFYYLGHNRVFSKISDGDSYNMLSDLTQKHYMLSAQQRGGAGQANLPPVNFKLAGQGQVYNFNRQGSPGTLSVMAMSNEFFSIVIWLLIIAVGILMLKVTGINRVMIIPAAIFAGGIIHLFQPVLITQILHTGWFPIVLVLLLWLGQWGYTKMPEMRKNAALRRQQAAEKKKKAEMKQQVDIKPAQKSENKKEQN